MSTLDSLTDLVEGFLPESIDKSVALGVVVAIVVVAATVVFLMARKTVAVVAGTSGNTILLAGPMGSGKTTLFQQLVFGKTRPTVTSQEANEGKYKDVSVVDFPGHDSQWPATMERLGSAKAVVFVINSKKPNVKVCAQKMYDVLSNPGAKARHLPILVVLNQMDSKDKEVPFEGIVDELTDELQSHDEMSDTIEDTDGNTIEQTLTDSDEPFSFKLSPCRVSFASVCAKQANRLGPLTEFFDSL
jgi:signal recognition particle receptor subunit beta